MHAEANALTAQADAIGIDTYAILDDIARTYADATQDQYNAAARDALAAAIARSNQDGGSAAAQTAPAAEPAQDTGLTAPARADIEAQQEARDKAEREEAARHAQRTTQPAKTKTASVQRWLADLLAAVKAWMFKKGIMGADRLTVADIAAVARANARSMARDGGATGGQGFGPAFSRAPAGDQTQTESFKRWFKDSKVVDAEGKPPPAGTLQYRPGSMTLSTSYRTRTLTSSAWWSPSPNQSAKWRQDQQPGSGLIAGGHQHTRRRCCAGSL